MVLNEIDDNLFDLEVENLSFEEAFNNSKIKRGRSNVLIAQRNKNSSNLNKPDIKDSTSVDASAQRLKIPNLIADFIDLNVQEPPLKNPEKSLQLFKSYPPRKPNPKFNNFRLPNPIPENMPEDLLSAPLHKAHSAYDQADSDIIHTESSKSKEIIIFTDLLDL